MDSIRQQIVRPADIAPSRDDFEVIGAFNPGAVRTPEGVVLLVRVAERPLERRTGFTGLPRWDEGQGVVVDWIANDELEIIDPRVVRQKASGLMRVTFISHLRAVRSRDGKSVDNFAGTRFGPDSILEEYGVEDPRITPLDGRYYITYVAVSRRGIVTALASTEDFRTFIRHGVIFGPENKDVVLFPERIGGEYFAIHRPSGGAGVARPGMWLARSPDLIHWGQHEHLLSPSTEWDAARNGAGPPPVRVDEGWLLVYHGCSRATRPGEIGVYAAGSLLLDAANPQRILRRCEKPWLLPERGFEREGFVPNVVFPTGIVEDGDGWLLYYGAADTSSAVVRLPRSSLV
jgi:beta-1,2-mannobiose phosphorylase / 1,2-beta-oligomannan phosphorylase